MKEENKKCWSCGEYQVYYTKGYAYFDKQKIGHCRKHNNEVCDCDRCTEWHLRQWHRNIRKGVALHHLSQILERLAAIEQILREENELDKIKYETDPAE